MDTSSQQKERTHEQIARRAYELWQQRGCPPNCDLELWLEAEQELTPVGRRSQTFGAVRSPNAIPARIGPSPSIQSAPTASEEAPEEVRPRTTRIPGLQSKPAAKVQSRH